VGLSTPILQGLTASRYLRPCAAGTQVVEAAMGIVVFGSVREALDAGYHIYGRTDEGYLARLRTERGWALAVIVISK
jgi:lipid-binding SYLF domain-containing protein